MVNRRPLLKGLNEKRYHSQNLNKKYQSQSSNRSLNQWHSPNQNLSHNQRKSSLLSANQNLENQLRNLCANLGLKLLPMKRRK